MSITPEEVAKLAVPLDGKPWRSSPSVPSRGFVAQVWDNEGHALLFLEDQIGPDADALAAFIAAAPDMAALIAEQAKELELLREYAARWAEIIGNQAAVRALGGSSATPESLTRDIDATIRQQGGKVGG